MHIPALSIGTRVPLAPFGGRVHSVFRAACNIEPDDGRLLTVLDARGNVPYGIRVAGGFDFRHLIEPGERVKGDGVVVRFARLMVDFSGAPPARTSLCHITLDMERSGSRAAWQAAWSKVLSAGQPDGLGVTRPRIAALVQATRALDATRAASAACGAIGLGSGLTPAWDDFLVGFLCALRVTARGRHEHLKFLAALCEAIRAAAHETSFVSRAQLEHAAGGHASELVVALLDAIAAGDVLHTVRATEHAVAVGSTSGTDTALGILCGCAAWDAVQVSEAAPLAPYLPLVGRSPRVARRVGSFDELKTPPLSPPHKGEGDAVAVSCRHGFDDGGR